MPKSGALNKIEKVYIEAKHKVLALEEIATDLDRSVTQVKNYIDKIKDTVVATVDTVKKRFTDSKGVTVMSPALEAAAEKAAKPVPRGRNYDSAIHKIDENRPT